MAPPRPFWLQSLVLSAIALLVVLAFMRDRRPPPADATAATPAAGFAAISVADLDRMEAWYRDLFAFDSVVRPGIPDSVGRAAVLIGPHWTVELLEMRAAGPRPGTAEASPMVHGLFKAGTTLPSLEPLMARVRELGVLVVAGPFDDEASGHRMVILRDPEGNLLHFLAPSGGP